MDRAKAKNKKDTFEQVFLWIIHFVYIYKNRLGEAILTNIQKVCFPNE